MQEKWNVRTVCKYNKYYSQNSMKHFYIYFAQLKKYYKEKKLYKNLFTSLKHSTVLKTGKRYTDNSYKYPQKYYNNVFFAEHILVILNNDINEI